MFRSRMFSQDACYVVKKELRLDWDVEIVDITTNRDSNIIHTMRKHIKEHKEKPSQYNIIALLRERSAKAD